MEENRPWCIYALIDPRTNEIRYVGMTHHLRARYRDHLNGHNKRNNLYKNRWVAQLRACGLAPIFYLLEEGIGSGWKQAEQSWIQYCRDQQAPLTNLTLGGEGIPGYIPTPEARLNMSLAKKGKPLSPLALQATRARAQRLKGQKRPAEVGRKISEAKRGFRHSQATKDRLQIVIRALGYRHTDDAKKRIGESTRGRKMSDETKAKVSQAKKGTKPAPHTVAASIASRKGKPLTHEHRQRISSSSRHPQRCGLCRAYGHKQRTCPQRKSAT